MDVSAIVTRLAAQAPAFAQILQATTGGTQAPVSTQESLYALLQSQVSGRMYPLQLPEKPTHPSIVYQMVSSTPGVFEGFDVTHTDIFIMNVRGDDYDALLTLVTSIIAAMSGENIEITDILHDYDQSENLYRVNLEVSYSYISATVQTLPVAFVYPIAQSGSESAFDNFTRQRVDADYAVLVVTDSGNVPALLDEVGDALLGWQQSVNHHEMEYSSGSSIEGVGGMEVWREAYRDAYYIEQV